MDEDALRGLADQLGVDTEVLLDRWQGRPDRIIDDIFRIRDIDTGELRDLELFDVQRRVVHAYFYGDAGTLNLYKGRRIGYSFIIVASFLLEAMLYPDSYYPLVSRSLSQAKNRISDIQDLIDHAKVDIPTAKENTDYIELWNGAAFRAYSADSDTSRGDDSARAVLMDEMAFMEDEERASRAFGAFLALGENRKMVEVSTPNTKNDLFMQEHRRGSPDGENGVISIKQPTFKNAEEIDIHIPLYEQALEPVRPDINVDQLETERMSDPEGFGQEYLCRPVVDEYRFFPESRVESAMDRARAQDYMLGTNVSKRNGARRVAGVDIGIDRDDTAISIMDHVGEKRQQRALIVVDEDVLAEAGVRDPDPGNANHIAQLLAYLRGQMDIDLVILDKGGVGQTFERIVERKLGRRVVGFDFSASDDVADMMGDTNIALREENITLVPDDRLYDELTSVVKEKTKKQGRPSFSGKEHSESGKDDTAFATVLSAFPPNASSAPATRPGTKEREDLGDRRLTQKQDEEEELHAAANHGARSISRSKRSRSDKYRNRRTRR